MPDPIGECFFLNQCRAECHWGVGQGAQAQSPKLEAFIGANPSDFEAQSYCAQYCSRQTAWAPCRATSMVARNLGMHAALRLIGCR